MDSVNQENVAKNLKKKKQDNQFGPLMEQIDYTDFVKLFNPKGKQDEQLVRFAFDMWKALKKAMDMIGPFAYVFLKHPKLMLAYQLLSDVVKEKNAELAGMKKQALNKKFSNMPAHWVTQDLEDYLLDHGVQAKDLTAEQIEKILNDL